MHIELPAEASQFIASLVASGEYQSAQEAVVDGVRLLMHRKQLRVEIQKGMDELNSGLGVGGEEVFAELRERARRMMEHSE